MGVTQIKVDSDHWGAEMVDWNKERTLQDRIDDCGKLKKGKIDAKSGKLALRPQLCKQYRQCNTCLTIRVHEQNERFLFAIGEGEEIYMTTFESNKAATSFVKRVDIDRYLRCPQEDGSTVFFHTSEYSNGDSVPIKIDNELDLRYSYLFKTPEGKRITGNLGKKPPKEEKERRDLTEQYRLKFRVFFFHTEESEKIEECAPSLEMPEVVSLETLQAEIEKTEEQIIKIAADNGVQVVSSFYVEQTVWLDEIKWPTKKSEIKSKEKGTTVTTNTIDSIWNYYGEPDWPKKSPNLG
jgi:hypothetical protein